jgi:NAD(P)-dependent dehydrogenase (short-subunit alcohol dehydrogenase family)
VKIPENITALVTGGGGGLGRAFALELAKRKARVAVADIRLDAAEETRALLEAEGVEAIALQCDVSKIDDFTDCVRVIEAKLGPVELIVNNAGVAVAGPIGDIPIDDWSFIVGINLLGVVHGCHLVAPRMKATGRGWIINVASAAGLISTRDMGPYNVTKAGVVALSETLMQEVAEYGVNVTVLCPTFFKTNIVVSGRHHGDARMTRVATSLMERSKLQAPEVAKYAVDAVERGLLYAVPMADGLWMWRLKRMAPNFFYHTLSPRAGKWIAAKLAR